MLMKHKINSTQIDPFQWIRIFDGLSRSIESMGHANCYPAFIIFRLVVLVLFSEKHGTVPVPGHANRFGK